MDQQVSARRSFMSRLGAGVAAFGLGAVTAEAQSPAGAFRATRHPEDDWLDGLPGKHRMLKDLTANTIPNSRFVAAGVVAVTRSQEHGYALVYAG